MKILSAILVGTILVMAGIGWVAYQALNSAIESFHPVAF